MTVAEEKTAHMRVTGGGVSEGQPGAKFFASPARARFLIGRSEAELVNVGPAPADTGILRRSPDWPFDRFSTVLSGWAGKTAILLGGGPSLTLEHVEIARQACGAGRCKAIAVNDAYLLAPWADVLYAADSAWWEWIAAGSDKPALNLTAEQVRERFEAFPGERCTIQNSGANVTDAGVHMLRNKNFPNHSNELSNDPSALATGRNSAFQSVNLAILAGAKTIILLGIDGRPAKDGRTHWSGGHPRPTPPAAYEEYRRAWSAGEAAIKAAGVRVINASPGTFIDTFQKLALTEALEFA